MSYAGTFTVFVTAPPSWGRPPPPRSLAWPGQGPFPLPGPGPARSRRLGERRGVLISCSRCCLVLCGSNNAPYRAISQKAEADFPLPPHRFPTMK